MAWLHSQQVNLIHNRRRGSDLNESCHAVRKTISFEARRHQFCLARKLSSQKDNFEGLTTISLCQPTCHAIGCFRENFVAPTLASVPPKAECIRYTNPASVSHMSRFGVSAIACNIRSSIPQTAQTAISAFQRNWRRAGIAAGGNRSACSRDSWK